MHDAGTPATVIIVAAVLLFFLLGIAILIIIDHKARLPGGFSRNPFSLIGMRRDHPMIAFVTATILLSIIITLVLALVLVLAGSLGVDFQKEKPAIVTILSEERNAERIRHFHNLPKKFLPTQGKKNVCFHCHGDFPHSKEPMIRTIMNMHTQFTGCMTCHVDEKKVPKESLQLRWLNYSGIEVSGAPFGITVDENTGNLQDTDDYYSKIVAYQVEAGSKELLEIGPQDPKLKEFVANKGNLSDADKEAVKKRFHSKIRPRGRACSQCHTDEKKSFLPFRQLGFSERRISELTQLNIIGMIEKYKSFYISDMLGTDTDRRSTDKSSVIKNEKMQKDPRSWWKQMYDSPNEK